MSDIAFDQAGERLSRMFAALADPTRRDLVRRLARGDAILIDLATAYDMSVQAVAKHLNVLEDAGLVRRTRDARRRPCRLQADELQLLTGWLDDRRREVEERYERLDELLAELAGENQGPEHHHRRPGSGPARSRGGETP